MSVVEIQLSQGLVGLIDEEDAEFVLRWKWYAIRSKHTFYVIRNHPASEDRGRQTVRLHRELLKAPEVMEVDHINGNGLDNRRCNIRLATCAQNSRNRRSLIGSTSHYLGVSWHKTNLRWQAQIQAEGRQIHLGVFVDEVDAAKAYDDAARLYHGEFARLNFPAEEIA